MNNPTITVTILITFFKAYLTSIPKPPSNNDFSQLINKAQNSIVTESKTQETLVIPKMVL